MRHVIPGEKTVKYWVPYVTSNNLIMTKDHEDSKTCYLLPPAPVTGTRKPEEDHSPITWTPSPSKMAAGIYYLKLTIAGEEFTKEVVILK